MTRYNILYCPLLLFCGITTASSMHTFTYDGWNLIVDSSNTHYPWGLDLSGTP